MTQETRIYDFEKDSLDMPEPAAPVEDARACYSRGEARACGPVVTSQPTAADDSLAPFSLTSSKSPFRTHDPYPPTDSAADDRATAD